MAKPVTGKRLAGSGANKRSTKTRAKPKAASGREANAAARREAIIEAGLEEFIARGFAAARMEDIARRAGVAKGTIYLHFKDKEALFHELIRTALVPLLGRLDGTVLAGGNARPMLEQFVQVFVDNIVQSRRGDVVRLVIGEGARFPALAEFYFREVVSRGITAVRAIIEHGIAQGEIRHDVFARFPQLVIAPAMLSLVWQGLFNKYSPLDIGGMLKGHLDVIFDGGRS